MSEHVTHIAVAEDSIRIARADPNFSALLRDSVNEFPQAVRYGSTTRSGDMFIYPLLEKWKEEWEDSPLQKEKMAFVLGWACHLSADRTFKPVYRMTDFAFYARGYPGPSHASVYHDAVTLREVYQNGTVHPFHESVVSHDLHKHPAAAVVPINRIEGPFARSYASDLASLKKFLSHRNESDKSFEDMCDDDRQKFYVEVDRYEEAYHHPNPAWLRRYIIKPNFYDRNDPVISFARDIQNGRAPGVRLESLWKGIDNQSLYAQSLKLGYDFLMAANDFFTDKISLEQAKTNMRTGQPHTQSLDYYKKLVEAEEK